MHHPRSFVVDKKKKKNKTQQHPHQFFEKKQYIIQILVEEQANIVLWPGRASGTVFGCGAAGSMLLGILFADPRTCTIGTLVSCLLVDAHCFTFYYYYVVVLVDESFMNVLKNRRIIAGSFRF